MSSDLAYTNPALDRMRAGEVALGMIVRLGRTGDIARIAKSSGHDFIFIDGQHALYDLETVNAIAQTALGIGITPLVRVRSADDPDMPVLLDNCAGGIVVPDVNTADDARRAVARAKFPPVGRRSAGGAVAMFDFRAVPQKDALRILNDNTLLVCMVETPEGVSNVEAIAAVEGVDVVHVGCTDLLANMGKPGAYGDPEALAAIDRVLAACKKNGKIPGVGGDRDIGRQTQFIRNGARFLTTNADIAFLLAEASRRTEALRKALAG
jgi:2-keto-3-deoxy-L-rhamnonate aldolase RhmA